jgi:PAS domain-containing protein
MHIQNPGGQGFDLEFRIETKEKEIRWIWSRLFPVLDKSGRCDRLYGIAHDITEKKKSSVESVNSIPLSPTNCAPR